MCTVFFILLIVQVGHVENFVTTTAAVGEKVTLTCKRDASRGVGSLFWIKLVPGKMPEILGTAFTFDFKYLDTNSSIATKQEPGRFVLHFAQTRLDDTAFYFCLRSQQHNISFLNGTFLRIKEPEPDVTAVTQNSLSSAINEGDSLNLQCSVFSQSEKPTCPEERRVFWFRVSSAQSHPSLIYAQKQGDGKCEHNPETQPGQSCVFNLVKDNISFSDIGTYYCALAACGILVFGNGTKLEFEDNSIMDSQSNNPLLFLLSVSLALMLVVSALLVCLMRRKCCPESSGRNVEGLCGQQHNEQRREDSLAYSTAVFNQRKVDRPPRVKSRRKEETIYSDVRIFDKD